MSWEEVEGVVGHEVAHIANGDMVTMTLLQGVVNAFVMFFSRVIAFAISTAMTQNQSEDGNERDNSFPYMLNMILTIVLDIIFTLLGSLVVAAFSRWREFHADAGGANLAGRSNMIAALQRLRTTVEAVDNSQSPAMAAFKISNKGGFLALFSTHPPLEERIARLKKG